MHRSQDDAQEGAPVNGRGDRGAKAPARRLAEADVGWHERVKRRHGVADDLVDELGRGDGAVAVAVEARQQLRLDALADLLPQDALHRHCKRAGQR